MQPKRSVALALSVGLLIPTTVSAATAPKPGTYVGRTQAFSELRFRVRRDGRAITGFDTTVVAYCVGIGPTTGPLPWRVRMPTFKLSRTGRFDRTVKTTTADGRVQIRVRGWIVGSRLSGGRLEYSSTVDGNECKTDGPQPITATRRGP